MECVSTRGGSRWSPGELESLEDAMTLSSGASITYQPQYCSDGVRRLSYYRIDTKLTSDLASSYGDHAIQHVDASRVFALSIIKHYYGSQLRKSTFCAYHLAGN